MMIQPHGGPKKPKKVLIVDDSSVLNNAMKRGADDAECDVEQAFSGNEAIAMIKDGNSFDVVITDTRMEDGDGISVLEFLYKTYGAGTRAMTYIISSISGYEINGKNISLPDYVAEHFPGTKFILKDVGLREQIQHLLQK